MLTPADQYTANIEQVRSLISVARAIDSQTTSAISVDDVYRASLVLGVSALDHYFHEKTLVEMLAIVAGRRTATPAFARFRVSIGSMGVKFDEPVVSWIEQEVRLAHSSLTFQRADAISDAVRLFHPEPLWPKIATRLRRDTKDVKDTLDLIVDRRNRIAHEADCEPSGLELKWPISSSMVSGSIDFLDGLVECTEAIV